MAPFRNRREDNCFCVRYPRYINMSYGISIAMTKTLFDEHSYTNISATKAATNTGSYKIPYKLGEQDYALEKTGNNFI